MSIINKFGNENFLFALDSLSKGTYGKFLQASDEEIFSMSDVVADPPSGLVGDAVKALELMTKTTASNFKDGTGIGLQGLGSLNIIAAVASKIVAGFPIVSFTFPSYDFLIIMIIGLTLIVLGSSIKMFEFYCVKKMEARVISTAIEGSKLVQTATQSVQPPQRTVV